MFGWFGDDTDTSGSGYTPITPTRVLDTRTTGSSPVVAGADRAVQLAGIGSVRNPLTL